MTHPKSFYTPIIHPQRVKNIAGKRFGRLTALGVLGIQNNSAWWYCVCDCGKDTDAPMGRLGRLVNSCGCLQREAASSSSKKHGYTQGEFMREYNIWRGMKARCLTPSHKLYKNYGGRGIKICDEWKASVERFIKDMGKCPDGYSIDRIDNDGNYEPSNCRWASREQQSNNTRENVFMTFNGQTKTGSQWGKEVGISPSVILSRIRMGWSPENVLNRPVRKLSSGVKL